LWSPPCRGRRRRIAELALEGKKINTGRRRAKPELSPEAQRLVGLIRQIGGSGRKHIDHTRTKAKSPQTNGICERFHKTVLDEFYRVAFRKKLYRGIDDLQADLDAWLKEYNEIRTHQGRWCFGKTPMQTYIDTLHLAKEKSVEPA